MATHATEDLEGCSNILLLYFYKVGGLDEAAKADF